MGAVQDSYITIAWLVLLVVLLVIEIITVGLTTIWGAGGALAALILNIGQTGMAVVNGTEWTVRSEQDDVILEPGTLAKVVNISGVKLIVQKYEED